MNTKTLNKTIVIHALPQKVWQILLDSPYIDEWYGEFGEGLHTETNWSQGSEYRVAGKDGWGMIGKIAENTPNKVLSIEFTGIVNGNKDDYESAEADKVKGQHETYRLFETQGGTKLEIETAAADEYYDMMAAMWNKALIKIKKLSENI